MRPATSLADDITLTETLRLAVPLYLDDLAARPVREQAAVARRWAADGARAVGERGDLLQFVRKSSISGTTRLKIANTFEQLARGLAGLVVLHEPGVDVAGLHWCLRRDCQRCSPPRVQPATPLSELNAQLEALDAEYRALAGLPPWEPQPSPIPASTPPARFTSKRRSVVDVHLPEVA